MAHVLAHLTTHEKMQLLGNSIERVINTTRKIIQESQHEDAQMNDEDWDALKSTVVKIFNNARDEVFIERNMSVVKELPYVTR